MMMKLTALMMMVVTDYANDDGADDEGDDDDHGDNDDSCSDADGVILTVARGYRCSGAPDGSHCADACVLRSSSVPRCADACGPP